MRDVWMERKMTHFSTELLLTNLEGLAMNSASGNPTD